MLQQSVSARNGRIAGVIAAAGASPILKIRSGPPPANCAAADSGTVLATANLPSTWMNAPANGAATKAGTWEDSAADASGPAGHFRIYGSDGVTCHLQGNVAQAWAQSTAYVVGQQVSTPGGVYRCTTAGTSAGTGTGPSGTGTGIADGSAAFAYLGTLEMLLDASIFNAGQGFSVTAFSLTAGNS